MDLREPVLAWHFASTQMRDGTPLAAPGEIERYNGEQVISSRGLHGSVRALDAVNYAPGALVRRVKCFGITNSHDNKFVCAERHILWEADATPALRQFARWCALRCINEWDAPLIVRKWLLSADPEFQSAARPAAWSAAWSAARSDQNKHLENLLAAVRCGGWS